MIADLKYNLIYYLSLDRKKWSSIFVLTLLIPIAIFYYSWTHYTYDIYYTNAQTICEENACYLSFYYPYQEQFIYDFIKIKEKKYTIGNIQFEELTLDNVNNGYQKIALEVKEYNEKKNEIVKLKIYKNKEKIIKKIYKMIIER